MQFENIKIIEKNSLDIKDLKRRFDKSLKNLLAIKSRGDNSIFMKINKSTSFDLFNILDWNDLHKILNNASFSIKVPRISKFECLNKLMKIDSWKDLINFLDDYNIEKRIVDNILYIKNNEKLNFINEYED